MKDSSFYVFFIFHIVKKKIDLPIAIAINVLFFALFAVLGVFRYGALDDYFISTVLTGAYGSEFDPHLVFVNGVLAYCLMPLYFLFSSVGWFYIFEMSSIFGAFTLFSYCLIRQLGFRLGVPLAVLLSSVAIEFYASVSFTICAPLLAASGAILFVKGSIRKKLLWLATGCILLVLGAMLRFQMFLLVIPFLGALLLWAHFPFKAVPKKSLIALVLCGLVIYGVNTFDDNLYKDSEYKYYKEYQYKRAFFGDGAHYDKEAISDELEGRGMVSLDFQLLCAWNFYDTQVFSKDSLDAIIKIANRNVYVENKQRLPAAVAMGISSAFTRNMAWCWCFVCVLILLFTEKKSRLYPWVSLALVIASYIYLLQLNRLVSHVEMGIWLYAAVMGIPLLQRDNAIVGVPSKISNRLPIIVSLFALVFFVATVLSLPKENRNRAVFAVPEMFNDWRDFLEYANENVNNVYLLSFYQYKDLGFVKNPPYRAAKPGSWQNIIPIGYWNINLPGMKRELEKRGVENPLRDIVNDNVYTIETGNNPSYQLFYKIHYHKNLAVDTVQTFGNLMVLKYREEVTDGKITED